MRLAGKVAIVTGAKSGIGLATATRLARDGATVVLADVTDAQEEAALIAQQGAIARYIPTDVSQESQVSAMTEDVVSAHGSVDILINNAGVELAKTILDTTVAEWDRLMNVNLKGVFLCSKAVLPVMQRQGSGTIVNVSSEQGLVGAAAIAAYTATKGGVIQLTKSMAIDHARDGIRVNSVAPGPIATPLFDRFLESAEDPDGELRSVVEATLLKRLGRPEEIANVIAFLASDEASYMTGTVVVVDGGLTAQ